MVGRWRTPSVDSGSSNRSMALFVFPPLCFSCVPFVFPKCRRMPPFNSSRLLVSGSPFYLIVPNPGNSTPFPFDLGITRPRDLISVVLDLTIANPRHPCSLPLNLSVIDPRDAEPPKFESVGNPERSLSIHRSSSSPKAEAQVPRRRGELRVQNQQNNAAAVRWSARFGVAYSRHQDQGACL